MSIASLKVVPEDMRTSIIQIYSYRDRNPQGTFYNPYYGEEVVFENLTQLLFTMENLMDEMGYPQASARTRGFKEGPKRMTRTSVAKQLLLSPDQEAIATFKVKVLFRQGASWQGRVCWTGSKEEMSFRSALELIKLIDSALPQPEPCVQITDSEVTGTG